MSIANIDGDVVVYEAGFSSDTSYYVVADEELFPSLKEAKAYADYYDVPYEAIEHRVKAESLNYCLARVTKLLTHIMTGSGCLDYKVFLTGEGNFREEVATSLPEPFNVYKGNRQTSHKPYWYKEIRQFLIDSGAVVCDGIEADDALGYRQHEDTVLCTIDKDLKMIQGWHYNWRNNEKVFITAQEAEDFHSVQLLTGDRTDNIPGLYALTGKKATAKVKKELLNLGSQEERIEFANTLYGRENEEHFKVIFDLITIAEGPATFIPSANCSDPSGKFYDYANGVML